MGSCLGLLTEAVGSNPAKGAILAADQHRQNNNLRRGETTPTGDRVSMVLVVVSRLSYWTFGLRFVSDGLMYRATALVNCARLQGTEASAAA